MNSAFTVFKKNQTAVDSLVTESYWRIIRQFIGSGRAVTNAKFKFPQCFHEVSWVLLWISWLCLKVYPDKTSRNEDHKGTPRQKSGYSQGAETETFCSSSPASENPSALPKGETPSPLMIAWPANQAHRNWRHTETNLFHWVRRTILSLVTPP